MLRLFHFSTDCPEILKLKKSNVILVELSYIDLVLKFQGNRLKNEKALAFWNLAIFRVKIQDGHHFHGNKGAKKMQNLAVY